MKVAVLGGGPAGLYFAISMKLRDPAHEVTVFERNRPDDTFGWGVVLSDETLGQPRGATTRQRRLRSATHFAYWDDIAVIHKGVRTRLGRPRLLRHRPQAAARCCCRGAPASSASSCASRPRSTSPSAYARDYDLVVAADGLNSQRAQRPSPTSSSPTSTCASASSSGSARTRNSTTPSPSSSRRPSTAGCGRTPTSSTPTPRPSSSSAREETWDACGFGDDDAGGDRSPPASASSPSISAAMR